MEILKIRNNDIYYSIRGRTLGRAPSKSNIKPTCSDNSLYFGMITDEKITSIICEMFGLNNINEFSGKRERFVYQDFSVWVSTNINKQGQIQIKIEGNGSMYKLLTMFKAKREIDINRVVFFVEFNNKKIDIVEM